jgi:ABC-type Fe3+/spermidine/putrescine transport system ATPase subunit
MLGGFVVPDSGAIEIDGQDVTRVPPERRPTNMVFQGYGLFPHMTVAENVAFGPSVARWAAAEIRDRVAEALALVRLEGLAERGIDRLSGGQQQRVALARALVMRPRVLLLDEPLAALDLQLRQAMQEELRRIHRAIGGTFVFVTHDQGEAFHLADRVIVMDRGRIAQAGTPEEVYRAPATPFVAEFVGEMNRLGDRWLRPEACRIVASGDGRAGLIEDSVFLGAQRRYLVRLADGPVWRIYEPADRPSRPLGARVAVTWDDAQALRAGRP